MKQPKYMLTEPNIDNAKSMPAVKILDATCPCVVGDTPVATPHGWVAAKHIRKTDWITTVLGRMSRVAKVERSHCPVFRVRFADGAEVCATADHQLHTLGYRGYEHPTRDVTWKPTPLRDLKVGDIVRVARAEMPDEYYRGDDNKPEHVQDGEFGFFAGLVLLRDVFTIPDATDPFLCINVGKASQPLLEAVELILKMLEGTGISIVEGKLLKDKAGVPVKHGDRYITCAGKPAKLAVIISDGLPERYLNSNKAFLAGFLNALFSLNGRLETLGLRLSLTLATRRGDIAQDVRRILLAFGVHAQIVGRKVGYDVRVIGDNIRILADSVGFENKDLGSRVEHELVHRRLSVEDWTTKIVAIKPMPDEEEVFTVYAPETDTWLVDGIVSRG